MMSEWKEYKLSEVYDFGSGLSKPRSEFGFGYGFLSYKDVFHNYFIPENLTELVNSTEKEQQSCSIKRGDVFLTRTSETDEDLGMSCVALQDYPNATFNGFTKRLRPNGKVQILPEYAGFYFRNSKFRAEVSTISSITTRASLNNGMLTSLSIIVPSVSEQKEIAKVVKSLHDEIYLFHRQNATLEKMVETLFRKLFVVEAKEIWEVVKLETLISLGSGKSLRKEFFIETGLYPILGANGEIGRTNQYLFEKKHIYTGRVGTLGNIFRIENEKVWLSDNTLVITPNEYFNYIYFILKGSRLSDLNVGSTQPLIRQSDIKEIELFLPPVEILQNFEEFADRIFEKIKSNKKQIRTLTVLRDTLLPKLMSGEVRVEI